MLETSRKWGMLALALATAGALVAPVALRPTQAYAEDGIEVVEEGADGIDLEGATPFRKARVVGKDYEVELGNGTYFYEEGNAFSHGASDFRSVEVTGDATLVFDGKLLLTEGGLHVREGAHLRLVAKDGCEARIILIDGTGANPIFNEGDLELEGVEVTGGSDCVVNNGGTLSMRRCKVAGNGCPGIHNGGELTLDGCAITNNGGYGVYSNGKLALAGATVIDGNDGANLLFDGGNVYPQGLTDGARVGVTIGDGAITGIFTDTLTNSPDATKAQYFFADEHGKQIITEPIAKGAVAIEVADVPGHKPDLAYVDPSDPDNRVKYRNLDQFDCDLGKHQDPHATLNSAWYYVSQSNTIEERIDVAGDAAIVLCNNATLTCNKGIHVPQGSSLTIYGQDGNNGMLVCNAKDETNCAGIGGNDDESNGTITIYGGNVITRGGDDGAGIGAGDDRYCGNIAIWGGFVEAVGGDEGPGIGDGNGLNDHDWHVPGTGTVEIHGGYVKATGGDGAGGIGGGPFGEGVGTVKVTGGEVWATGGPFALADGGGDGIECGTAEILGGTVNAYGTISDGCGLAACKGGVVRNAILNATGDYIGIDTEHGFKVTLLSIEDAVVNAVGKDKSGIRASLDIKGNSKLDISSDKVAVREYEPEDGFYIKLGDNLKVTDLSENVGRVATFGEREAYFTHRAHVKVEPGESAK